MYTMDALRFKDRTKKIYMYLALRILHLLQFWIICAEPIFVNLFNMKYW